MSSAMSCIAPLRSAFANAWYAAWVAVLLSDADIGISPCWRRRRFHPTTLSVSRQRSAWTDRYHEAETRGVRGGASSRRDRRSASSAPSLRSTLQESIGSGPAASTRAVRGMSRRLAAVSGWPTRHGRGGPAARAGATRRRQALRDRSSRDGVAEEEHPVFGQDVS